MSAELDPGPLRLHPLAFLDEDGEVVVGRVDIDSFGVFPADGAALVRQLAAGRSASEAAAWYTRTYREDVNIAEFITTLRELQFVCEDGEPASAPRQVRWQQLGRALFSIPAWIAYAALVISALLVCLANPELRPRPSNVLFSDYLLLVAATVVIGQLIIAGIHELFHVLAGRRLGVRSSVHISRRFYFIVFETNLDGLAVLPRRQRVLPIMAGLLCDSLSFSALTILAYLTRASGGPASAVCLALAFTTLPRMAWQFYVFLRTDIYYLITTLTGCVDVDAAARATLANALNLLLGRGVRRDLSRFHPRDRRAAGWFAVLLVGGYATMIAFGVITLPVLWHMISGSAERVFLQKSTSTAGVWDAAIFGGLIIAQVIFILTLVLRRQRRRLGKTTNDPLLDHRPNQRAAAASHRKPAPTENARSDQRPQEAAWPLHRGRIVGASRGGRHRLRDAGAA